MSGYRESSADGASAAVGLAVHPISCRGLSLHSGIGFSHDDVPSDAPIGASLISAGFLRALSNHYLRAGEMGAQLRDPLLVHLGGKGDLIEFHQAVQRREIGDLGAGQVQ